ncbi:hypothetical protein FB2170_06760 [Maribacter sp. HTCC2170]|nr:hypothetical protein FB2170_06760 [Maribacter sp. HTCC2170]
MTTTITNQFPTQSKKNAFLSSFNASKRIRWATDQKYSH